MSRSRKHRPYITHLFNKMLKNSKNHSISLMSASRIQQKFPNRIFRPSKREIFDSLHSGHTFIQYMRTQQQMLHVSLHITSFESSASSSTTSSSASYAAITIFAASARSLAYSYSFNTIFVSKLYHAFSMCDTSLSRHVTTHSAAVARKSKNERRKECSSCRLIHIHVSVDRSSRNKKG